MTTSDSAVISSAARGDDGKDDPKSAKRASSSKKRTKPCQECHTAPVLYVCPRCGFRSCSLACCVAHKKRTGCNGKRDKTAFLPLSRMSDATSQSDYHFLEDVLTRVESSQRTQQHDHARFPIFANQQQSGRKRPRSEAAVAAAAKGGAASSEKTTHQTPTPHPLLQQLASTRSITDRFAIAASSSLVSSSTTTTSHPPYPTGLQAKWRRFAQRAMERTQTRIIYVSPGMQRRLQNKSYIAKGNILHWTIEFHLFLPHPPSETKQDNSLTILPQPSQRTSRVLAETAILQDVLEAILKVSFKEDNTTAQSPEEGEKKTSKNPTKVEFQIDDEQSAPSLTKEHNSTDPSLLVRSDKTATTLCPTSSAPKDSMDTTTTPASSLDPPRLQSSSWHRDYQLLVAPHPTGVSSTNGGAGGAISSTNKDGSAVSSQQQHRPRRVYRAVPLTATVAHALQDLTVVEFPSLYLVARQRLNEFPLLMQDTTDEEEKMKRTIQTLETNIDNTSEEKQSKALAEESSNEDDSSATALGVVVSMKEPPAPATDESSTAVEK